jgi:hypothetical protein
MHKNKIGATLLRVGSTDGEGCREGGETESKHRHENSGVTVTRNDAQGSSALPVSAA